jgi:hypothetical protein
MSQSDPSNYVAVGTSGSDLVTKLNLSGGAALSTNKGPTAPTYAEAGTPWIDDSVAPWALKIYDGSSWIVQGYIDASANDYEAYDSARLGAIAATNYARKDPTATQVFTGQIKVGKGSDTGNEGGQLQFEIPSTGSTSTLPPIIDAYSDSIRVANFPGGVSKTITFDLSAGVTSGTAWHSGNDGPGSGLDADTVDTYEAAALLARANHTGTQAISTISDHNDAAHSAIACGEVVDQGGGSDLKTKVIEIGDWNMDSVSAINVAHGLSTDFVKIRSISVMIIDDGSSVMYPLNTVTTGTGSPQGGILQTGSTNIVLTRLTGGLFDGTGWDATSFNRGWVTIKYTA